MEAAWSQTISKLECFRGDLASLAVSPDRRDGLDSPACIHGGVGERMRRQGEVPTKVDRRPTMECGMPMALGGCRRGRVDCNETMKRWTKQQKMMPKG